MIEVLAALTAGLTVVGGVQALVGSNLVAAFARRPVATPSVRPPVTVLKPLHGDEPLLEDALTTLCRQDYPAWQIVCGVHDDADPAAAIVRRLQYRFPWVDITLVADSAIHGVNRKIGNIINMMPAARHDVLVIADSDVHAMPDYLDRLVGALEEHEVGLVTTLYAGLPAPPVTLAGRLGATQITHGFLPGAVLSRAFGRQDCLGATMCLRRRDLTRIGGFAALVDHLADDNILGRRITALGLRVSLAKTVPLTTVPETRLSALFRHELRWARTIRMLEPAGFAASAVQFTLAWGLLTIALSGGALWSIGLFMIAWVSRSVAALWVDAALAPLWDDGVRARRRGDAGWAPGRGDMVGAPGWDDRVGATRRGGIAEAPGCGADTRAALAFCCPVWLLPLRDVLSVAVMLASYGGRHVIWRGYGLQADSPPPSSTLRPLEGIKAR